MFLVGSGQEETIVGKERNQQASDRILGGHSLLLWRLAYIFWSKTRATVALKKVSISSNCVSEMALIGMWVQQLNWIMEEGGLIWCFLLQDVDKEHVLGHA